MNLELASLCLIICTLVFIVLFTLIFLDLTDTVDLFEDTSTNVIESENTTTVSIDKPNLGFDVTGDGSQDVVLSVTSKQSKTLSAEAGSGSLNITAEQVSVSKGLTCNSLKIKANDGSNTTIKLSNNSTSQTFWLPTSKAVDDTYILFQEDGTSSFQKLNVNETNIANSAITNDKIQNATISLSKLQPSSSASILLGCGSTSSGDFQEITIGANLNFDGTTLDSSDVAFNSVTNGAFVDGAVTSVKIGNSEVIEDNIAAQSVSKNKIVSNAIGTNKFEDGVVDLAKLETIPDSRLLGNNSGGISVPIPLTSSDIKNMLVVGDASVITTGQFPADRLESESITTDKFQDNAVDLTKIENINDASLLGNNTGGNAAPIPIDVGSINNLLQTTDSSIITSGQFGEEQLADNSVQRNTIQSSAITTAKLGDSSVSQSKINDNAVTLAKLANISDLTLIGNNTIGIAAAQALTVSETNALLGTNNASNITSGKFESNRLADGCVETDKIKDNIIKLKKIEDIPDLRILGNNTGVDAQPVALTIADVKTLLGTADAATITSGTFASARLAPNCVSTNKIADGAVSLSKIENINADCFLGNDTNTPSSVIQIGFNDAKTLLDLDLLNVKSAQAPIFKTDLIYTKTNPTNVIGLSSDRVVFEKPCRYEPSHITVFDEGTTTSSLFQYTGYVSPAYTVYVCQFTGTKQSNIGSLENSNAGKYVLLPNGNYHVTGRITVGGNFSDLVVGRICKRGGVTGITGDAIVLALTQSMKINNSPDIGANLHFDHYITLENETNQPSNENRLFVELNVNVTHTSAESDNDKFYAGKGERHSTVTFTKLSDIVTV